MKRHTARALLGAGGVAVALSLALTGCGQGCGGGGNPSASGSLTSSNKALTVMIGSSGDAETKAVTDAVAAWSKTSGTSSPILILPSKTSASCWMNGTNASPPHEVEFIV